ncbi:AMP-binding protein [Streptomyces sp. NPDC059466]|uniref:AMP-binding protein n=1 Tax=Streptomyces sp. NPDC059466 TaxID=3346843 RepID=UPI0036826F24
MPILRYLESPLDDLLRRAADRDGDAPAVVTAQAAVTFAALDREADRIAHYVRRTVRRADAVVAAATTLDAAFPAVYYGTVRSGRLLALLDPLMGQAALHEVCTAAGVEIAFVPGPLAALLAALADRLPRLHTIVVTDPTTRPASSGRAPGGSAPGGPVPGRPPSGVPGSGGGVVGVGGAGGGGRPPPRRAPPAGRGVPRSW